MDLDAIEADIKTKTKAGIYKAQDYVDSTFRKAIGKFYRSHDPSSYKRTYQLPGTVKKTAVRGVGLGAEADVYLDPSVLNYMNNIKITREEDGSTIISLNEWDGEAVLESAAEGLHGGIEGNKGNASIWNDPIAKFETEAERKIVSACRAAGLPI